MDNIEFKELLLKADTDALVVDMVRKHLLHGIPFVFQNRETDYFDFRNQIANHFQVGFHEVFIVGSAKLGFSYYKNTKFSLESDIDVVIVNEEFFESFYESICNYQYKIDKGIITLTGEEMSQYHKFLKYLIKGWMRPDKLPIKVQSIINKNDWFEYFKSISYGKSNIGNYKVAAGLFKSYIYLEKYYADSLKRLK